MQWNYAIIKLTSIIHTTDKNHTHSFLMYTRSKWNTAINWTETTLKIEHKQELIENQTHTGCKLSRQNIRQPGPQLSYRNFTRITRAAQVWEVKNIPLLLQLNWYRYPDTIPQYYYFTWFWLASSLLSTSIEDLGMYQELVSIFTKLSKLKKQIDWLPT